MAHSQYGTSSNTMHYQVSGLSNGYLLVDAEASESRMELIDCGVATSKTSTQGLGSP